MVNKLTFETINSKIGKAGDPASLEDIALPNKQFDEVGSFAKFAKLKKLDLSNNRFRFKRNIEGLFQAPILEELDLRGNPVCNEVGYRAYMIEGIKTLKVLDGVPVDRSEQVQKPAQNAAKKSSLFDDEEDDSDNLFANNPLSKNSQRQTSNPTLVKPAEENKIPAKTSAVKEEKSIPVEVPANEVSTPLPKEEKPVPVPKPVEKPKEVEEPQPVKKVEEKSKPQTPVVHETKPAQIEKPKQADPAVKKEEPKKTTAPAPKTEEKPKETAKETPISANNTAQSTPGVFKDSRSKLEISTKLHESIQAPEPQPVEMEQPKKEMLTEDSLFGSKKSVFQDNVTIDRSLLEITEVPQKKVTPPKEQPKPAAKVSVTIADDDDDDLFGTKSKPAVAAKKNVAASSGDDDLFDMVSTNKKDAVDLSKLNIDEYLASQSSANDSLFD